MAKKYKITGVDSDGTTLGVSLQEVVPEGAPAGDGFRRTVKVADIKAMSSTKRTALLKSWIAERQKQLADAKARADRVKLESEKFKDLKDIEVEA